MESFSILVAVTSFLEGNHCGVELVEMENLFLSLFFPYSLDMLGFVESAAFCGKVSKLLLSFLNLF